MTYAQIEAIAERQLSNAVGLDAAQRTWVRQDLDAGEAESAVMVLLDLAPRQFSGETLTELRRAFSGGYCEAYALRAIEKAEAAAA